MALNNDEINKINDLYRQIDVLTSENVALKDLVVSRFDKLDQSLEELTTSVNNKELTT